MIFSATEKHRQYSREAVKLHETGLNPGLNCCLEQYRPKLIPQPTKGRIKLLAKTKT
jgi:hypothetical protein